MTVSVRRITQFPPIGFGQLREEAAAEGFSHIEHLAEDWANRTQRFQLDGEALFVALADADRLAAIGGVTHDPELPPTEALRVRRLYVRPEFRRKGVGRVLLQRITEHALRHAPAVVANAGATPASDFFEKSGFEPVDEPAHTHRLTRGA